MTITANPNLSICNFPNFCTYLTSHSANISGNDVGCASQVQVLAYCNTPATCPNYSMHLTSQLAVDAFYQNFPNCTAMQHSIRVEGPDITNLLGLSRLTSIEGDLEIVGCLSLSNLAGMDGLNSIGGDLEIINNYALAGLSGLQALNYIGNNLTVSFNGGLTSLSGLENVDLSATNFVSLIGNPLLSTCDLPNICAYLSNTSNPANISGNATGCATRPEVEAACVPAVCPTGDLTFTTQQEIDDFPTDYPDCTQILGNVTITSESEITNLNGLSAVTSIAGNLLIAGNWDLLNLAGLNALTSVGGYLEFQATSLTSLNGLNALNSVGGELRIYYNPVLTNLSALNSLTSIGGTLSITENTALTSLSGLDNINPMSFNNLVITNNSSALTFCGVQSICDFLSIPTNFVTISGNGSGCNDQPEIEASCLSVQCPTGDLSFSTQQEIDDFPVDYPGCTVMPYSITITGADITDLNGLSQLVSIDGNMECIDNPLLNDLTGLSALTSIGGYLSITLNPQLTSLNGLGALASVGDFIDINSNAALANLDGLENLNSISGSLVITGNPSLTNLSGLAGLTSVNDFGISGNLSLTSLAGLESVNPNLLTNIDISSNGSLSVCDLPNICDYLSAGNAATISGNATGCATRPEVEAACAPGPCPSGNITLSTQQEVDDFPSNYPTCTVMPYSITVEGNDINSLTGLGLLTSIEGDLTISNNPSLTDVFGLGGLTSIGGSLIVENNTSLGATGGLQGLDLLSTIGENLYLSGNNALQTLNGLWVQSVGGGVFVTSNDNLMDVYLPVLETVGGDLVVEDNDAMNFIQGLDMLESVGGTFSIIGNDALLGLADMAGLITVNGDLIVSNNTILTSLNGLGNINPSNLDNLILLDNAVLSYCELANICTYLSVPTNLATISGNAPGCATRPEVEAACNPVVCPTGDLVFGTQQEIDDFPTNYPGCTVMPYSITIQGAGITSLNGLSQLVSIGGDLIIQLNSSLTNLAGLEGITAVGGSLSFSFNNSLNNLSALQSLVSLGGAMSVIGNPSLTNLSGLQSLSSINNLLHINSNTSMTSLIGLEGLSSVNGAVLISTNQSLSSLNGLQSLVTIADDLIISNNSSLSSIAALSNLGTVGGNLQVNGNGALVSFSGLNTLSSVGGYLSVSSNASMAGLDGLNGLISIGGGMEITANTVLNNLTALSSLSTIGGAIGIFNNSNLPSLSGLHNIDPNSITSLTLSNNALLSYCETPNICDYLSVPTNLATISGNAPGCATRPEVETACAPVVCPTENLIFSTQQQINDFPANYPGCTVMPFSITINGAGITNLGGLGQLVSINGDFNCYGNTALANFTGMEALAAIGGYFRIANNASLTSLNGLSGLTSVGNYFEIYVNPALTSVAGLGSLTTIGSSFAIYESPLLTSLSGLASLTSTTELNISFNTSLTSLAGLENIIPGNMDYMVIEHNTNLSICDIDNICTYLSNPTNPASIFNNAPGCATRTEVETACTPTVCPIGDLTFNTQQQIDDFPTNYPGCTVMPYSITINGAGVTNLNGLSQLTTINGDLRIMESSLTNLSGLGALASLGGNFIVSNNAALTTLAGLGPITSVDWLSIGENATLTNLNALNMVGSVAGNLSITSNPVLTNLTGLSALTSAGGDVFIFGNNMLTNLSGLNALTNIGGSLNVYSNGSMTDLTGLNALTSVTGGVDILYMSITSLSGLNNLNSIGGNLTISFTAIQNMSGLGSLAHLGGNLTLNNNGLLANVTTLAALTTIGGALTISNNGALTSLNGLHNVPAGTITSLVLTNNSLLSVCDLANICTYLSNPINPATISGNATGCATRPEVETACNGGIYTFTGATGPGWSVAANWAGGVVPPDPLPAGEEIVIAANCTRTWYTTIDGTITINSGVTLTINHAAEELTFTINGAGHNYGAINATEEDLVTGSGGSFTNYSGASVQATATFGGIVNNGQFTNEAGATVNVWGVGNSGTFTNAGTFTIGFIWTNLAGSTLNNSGNLTNSNGDGGLNNVAGAVINISGGIIQLSCGITNNGAINLSGGDLGLLRNPAVWPTGLNWTSGTVTLGGVLSIDAGVTITIPPGGTLTRQNGRAIFINSGGALVVNGTFIPHAGGFSVQNGGAFEISSASSVSFSLTQLSNSGTVTNAGTLTLVAGTSQNNDFGIINNSGILNINGYFVTSGTLSNSGTINNNGSLELNTNPSQFPAGIFNWNSGSIVRIGINGQYTLDNTLTVPSGCAFVVQSLAPFTITAGGQLINNGSTTLNAGTTVNNGTLINNSSGNLTLQSGSLTNNGTLTNAGFLTFRSTFTNAGTINQNSGELYYCIPLTSLLPGGNFNWNGGGLSLGRPSVCTCTATLDSPFTLPPSRSLSLHPSSSLINNSSLVISPSGSFGVWGTLTNNSVIENNGFISPFVGSNFTNNGLIKGTGSQQGTVGFTNGPNGTVAPGASPGCYGFLQGFTNQGTLSMEIDGTTFCSQYDRLANSGTTTLGGTLHLTFSITPTVGQMFPIITSTSIVGSFSTINVTPSNITVSQSGGEIMIASLLPIELTAFSAEKVEKSVHLHWQTASETNNRGFEVQRSDDGARWQEIGFVNGYGTTTETQHYTLIDKEPLGGTNYYRLRQIDFDGTASLSNIVAVKGSDKHSELKLNPNPASDVVEIKGVDLTSEPLLKIMDATGRPLREQRLSSSTLDVSALPPGMYYLILYDSKGAFQTGRLVRQ